MKQRTSEDPMTEETTDATSAMSGLDSAFLAVETPSAHMHMTAVVTLEPVDGRPATFDTIRAHLAPRLRGFSVFRKQPFEVPLGLDHPVWIDGEIDLDAHVHRMAVPAPGSRVELEEIVGHLAELPLDRTRPLWELWVVEGLDHGRTALVTKVHHALMDGVAGAEILGRLFDADPAASARQEAPESGCAASSPSRAHLLRAAAQSFVRKPFQVGRQAVRSITAAARGVRSVVADGRDDAVTSPVLGSPETPLNGAITSRRRVALGDASLDRLRSVARTFDVRLNDVVLGICSGALRRYLADAGEALREPLRVAVPVAIPPDSATSKRASGNRVSLMTVELPVQLADPVSRLVSIRRNTLRAKRAHRAAGMDWVAGWADVAPPVLLSGVAELYSRLDLADRHRPIVNLIVSNVAGPDFSLYCAGHRLQACYPLGPIYEGCASNLTVMSYDGRVFFGWVACPDTVPELARLGASMTEASDELCEVADRWSRGVGRRPAQARGERRGRRDWTPGLRVARSE